MQLAIDGRMLHRTMSGTERYMRELIKRVSKLDAAHDSVFVTVGPDYTVKGEFENAHLIGKITADQNIDVYHRTFQVQNYGEILDLLIPKRSIITVLDLIGCKFVDHYADKKLFDEYCDLMRYALTFTDRIIAISEHGKKDMIETFFIPEDKIEVIPLGVDTHKFRKINDREVGNFKKRSNLPNKYILFVGSDYPHKNLASLLKAFSNLTKAGRLKDYRLVVAGNDYYLRGNGFLRPELKELGDKVKNIGYVDDALLPLLYNGADMFVYPSLYEGFGFPVLEAFACGTPVVCSNATSLPEVVGDAALLVDASKPDEISRAVAEIVNDDGLRHALIEKGRKRAELFPWELCAQKTHDLYRETLARPEYFKNKNSRELKEFLSSLASGSKTPGVRQIAKLVFKKPLGVIRKSRGGRVFLRKANRVFAGFNKSGKGFTDVR